MADNDPTLADAADYDLVPVDHVPQFVDTPGVGYTPTSTTDPITSRVAAAGTGMAQGVANMLAAPGNVAQGQQPQTRGQWSDVDEAIRQANMRGESVWGPQMAMNLVGAGSPAAEAGAAGIFGGRLAKTADLKALEQAEQMAAKGASKADIWDQTGWFQGADQKWRFEIPDTQARYNPEAMAPKTYHFSGNEVQSREGAMRDVLTHPELYRAYPDLQDITVGQVNYPNLRGVYHPPSRGTFTVPEMIGLDRDIVPSASEGRNVMLHEGQHVVQEREGFSPGSNEQAAPVTPNPDLQVYRDALQNDPEMQRYLTLRDSAEHARELEAANELWRQKYQPQLEEIYKLGRDYKPAMADAVFAQHKIDTAGMFPTMEETDRLADSLRARGIPRLEPKPTLEPFEAYRRTAGETEARNVQARADMTPLDLRDTPPWRTQDVATSRQTVLAPGAWPGKSASAAAPTQGIRAYHGSPYDFDQFDLSKIGTGEGAQPFTEMLTGFHGTKSVFNPSEFNLRKAGVTDPGLVGRAVYMSPSGEQASSFAESTHYGRGEAPNVMPLQFQLQNPLVIEDGVLPDGRRLSDIHPNGITKDSASAIKKEIISKGHDGVVFTLGGEPVQYAVYDPKKLQPKYRLVPVDHQPDFGDQQGMATGGAVQDKTSKAKAHYRGGSKLRHCSICTMFQPPDGCSAVRGQISPQALCDFFKRVKDAKTLYVMRPLLNAGALIAWAKSQGFKKTVKPTDMHVTIAFSRDKVDHNALKRDRGPLVASGGKRTVKPLGDEGAVVLTFESSELSERWREFRGAGASWDWESYQPHVTITYDGEGLDLKGVKPYMGPLRFGPEQFSELDEGWKDKIKET